ncbi:MAG: type II secretion system F family protein [Magnetococcus sp. WYHC-3]
MTIFVWEALAPRADERRKGEIEADESAQVLAQLRRGGYRDIRIRPKKLKRSLLGGQSINEKEIVVLTRQLATMVAAGLPLVTCFDLVGRGSENQSLRNVAQRIKVSIEGGTSLTEALSKEPRVFDELFVNLVRAGEQSGILEAVLNRLAVYKEKSSALRGRIKSAMIYPVAVLVVAFLITGILMIFVVPTFAELFASFGAELPFMTRIVIAVSEWTQSYWWLVILAIAAGIWSFRQGYRRSEAFHYSVDKWTLRLPVFGMILRKGAVARFARTFATMVAAGTPILESLDNVARTAGNRVVAEAIQSARSSISEGRTLAEPLSASEVFPPMVTQMISIGESTGNLELMLTKVADFYEEEVDRAVSALTSLLEPIILVILGTLIGGLVVAMYLPIFQMGSVVG